MSNQNAKNIFEIASRKKLRFPSARGALRSEDLWEVPLTSKDGFSLNDIAMTINGELQEKSSGHDFVKLVRGQADAPPSQDEVLAQVKMDIVLFVMKDKVDAENAAQERVKIEAKL